MDIQMKRGLLEVCVLAAIKKEDSYGYQIIKDMKPEDKVKTLAFSVCGAFLFGDHLAFTANYQPSLILPVMLGKLVAAILSVIIASKFIVPRLDKMLAKNNA